jgi:hypothetical protein
MNKTLQQQNNTDRIAEADKKGTGFHLYLDLYLYCFAQKERS